MKYTVLLSMVLLLCMSCNNSVSQSANTSTNASDFNASAVFEEKTFLFQGEKIQDINLKNKNGLILIKTTSNANQVNLKIRKEVSGVHDKSKAQAYLKAIKEDVQLLNGKLSLTFEYPSITSGSIKSDVVVEIPEHFVARNWDSSTGNGQIKVSDLKANTLSVTVGNGEVYMNRTQVENTSNFTLNNGSLEMNDISSKELVASVSNGNIVLSGFNKEISQLDLTVDMGSIDSRPSLPVQNLGVLGQKYNYQPQRKLQSIKLHVNIGSIRLN